MRHYDATDKYDIEEATRLNAKPWQLDLLKLNPGYCSWGPHEDYMIKDGSGWDTRQIRPSWDAFGFELDDLNECVNFYFSVDRESRNCETCGGECCHPDAQWISESFYGHSTPFRRQTRREIESGMVLARFGGAPTTQSVVSGFPSEETLAKYGPEFRAFCEAMRDGDGTWNTKITEDEAQALVKDGRGKLDKLTTAADFNAAEGRRGLSGHDAINRWILIRRRCERMGVPLNCPSCDGHGIEYIADEAHVSLTLWILHPRKGCSRGVEITKLAQADVPKAMDYLRKAAARNAERFAALK